jgi:hypothetical protein
MKITKKVVESSVYTSEVRPEISTENDFLGPVVEWADAHPIVWSIVTTNKSAVFGFNSSEYVGYIRGRSPDAAIARAAHFRDELESVSTFHCGRAEFAMTHFKDKGFSGGLLKQWDGTYERGCALVDITPERLEEVIDRFLVWCDAGPNLFPTVEVRLDRKVVRVSSVEAAEAHVKRILELRQEESRRAGRA